jgi:hypothetical protein
MGKVLGRKSLESRTNSDSTGKTNECERKLGRRNVEPLIFLLDYLNSEDLNMNLYYIVECLSGCYRIKGQRLKVKDQRSTTRSQDGKPLVGGQGLEVKGQQSTDQTATLLKTDQSEERTVKTDQSD